MREGFRHNAGMCKENCFGCKVQSLSFSAAAMPTRSGELGTNLQFEKQRNKDNEAYKRLRRQGYQPSATRGAARVEALANSRFEVESGQMLGAPAKIGRQMDDVQSAINKGEISV